MVIDSLSGSAVRPTPFNLYSDTPCIFMNSCCFVYRRASRLMCNCTWKLESCLSGQTIQMAFYYFINSNLNVRENRHFGQMGIMRLMFSISEPGTCIDRTIRWPHLCEQSMPWLLCVPGKTLSAAQNPVNLDLSLTL